MASTAERRHAVREVLAAGDVEGLRTVAEALAGQGISVTPDELRADVRALGAVRVQRGDASVLALPMGDAPSAPTASPEVGDPDVPLQLTVLVVVGAFLLLGLVGWLLSV